MRKGTVLLVGLVVIWTGSENLLAQTSNQAQPDTARVEKYAKKRIINAKWGSGPEEFGPPYPKQEDKEYDIYMKMSPEGHLWITDLARAHSRIHIFDNEGKFIRSQNSLSRFWTYDFDMDAKGNVYAIKDNGSTGVITAFNPKGERIGEYPATGEGWLGDGKRWSLAIGKLFRDSSEKVHAVVELSYLAEDIRNLKHVIKMYDLDVGEGNILKVKSHAPKELETFDVPKTIDKSGYRWAIDDNIQKIDSKGKVVFRMNVPFTRFSYQGKEWWIMFGDKVVVDKDGNFYILSPKSNGITVYKYSSIKR